MSFDFQLCYNASFFCSAKETKYMQVDNDGWDFSAPFRGTLNSKHMAKKKSYDIENHCNDSKETTNGCQLLQRI